MKKQLKHELKGVITMIMEEEADWKQWVKNSRTGEERLEREEEVKIALNALHLLRCKVRNRIDELNVPEPEEED
jgi:hypothetical protein